MNVRITVPEGSPEMSYTYIIMDNGREVENLDAGTYATREDANIAAAAALDDVCPPCDPMRKFYRAEVVGNDDPVVKYDFRTWDDSGDPCDGWVLVRLATNCHAQKIGDGLTRSEAAMFAAAPDLLAACKKLLPHVDSMIERANPGFEDTSQYSDQTAVRLARAAIARAEGNA